jgi:hypothetical protein
MILDEQLPFWLATSGARRYAYDQLNMGQIDRKSTLPVPGLTFTRRETWQLFMIPSGLVGLVDK